MKHHKDQILKIQNIEQLRSVDLYKLISRVIKINTKYYKFLLEIIILYLHLMSFQYLQYPKSCPSLNRL